MKMNQVLIFGWQSQLSLNDTTETQQPHAVSLSGISDASQRTGE